MKRIVLVGLVLAGLVSACRGETDPAHETAAGAAPGPLAVWSLEAETERLVAASCPDGVGFARATRFDITASPVELGPDDVLADRLTGVTFAGGWHLTSDWAGFGGLSGLALTRAGNLVAISDRGHFVWIAMQDGAPTGGGHHGAMRDARGDTLSGKRAQDAEGLAMGNGIALVSFERDHRILAFDLEGCGANARGSLLAGIAGKPRGLSRRIAPNSGLEGLALTREGHLIGALEHREDGVPVGRLGMDAHAGRLMAFDERHAAFGPLAATGMDMFGDTLVMVHRHYDRTRGNTIRLTRAPMGEDGRLGPATSLARLDPEMTVDNFEAVAVQANADGPARIYLLADDNFNDAQRTLLLAFDLVSETGN